MYWVDTQDGHYCTRHSYAFSRGDVCQRCVTDPGDEIGSGVVDRPEYQSALTARIAEYTSRSKACWSEVEELRKGTDRDAHAAAKWSSEAVKWARLAEERQDVLDNRDHDLELLRHEREMAGQRRGN